MKGGLDQKIGINIDNVHEFVVGHGKEVPLYDGTKTPYVYFDNGASTPILRPVLDKVNEFMEWYSSVHRGTGFKSQLSSKLHEECREIVARFVNVNPDDHAIIFGKNATEAINKLANRLTMDGKQIVLVSKMEHHSNDLPWRTQANVKYVEVDEMGRLSEEDLIQKLDYYGPKVGLFAVTGASNVSGWVNDIHRLAEICHKHDVKIMVDAAQLMPHRRVDMRPPDDPGHIDFLAFSAHKIYAPLGAGVLIGDKDVFLQGEPDMVGGGTVDVVSLDYTYWAEVPEKEEAGSPNTAGIIGLAKALLVLEEIGMDNVAAHEERLTRYLLQKLQAFPTVTIYGGVDPDDLDDRLGVIAFNVRGIPNALVAAVLSHEAGIGVRNGCFCAQPYMKHLLKCSDAEAKVMEEKIFTRQKFDLPGAVRVSFGIYNNEAEIDRFIECLDMIVKREWKGEYEEDPLNGEFHLKAAQPEFDSYFCL